MVLTRSGRNAGGGADVVVPRTSRAIRGKATSQEEQAQQDAPSSPGVPETKKIPFPKLPLHTTSLVSEPLPPHADDLVAADTAIHIGMKFTEKQVMFSPRGAAGTTPPPPTSTAPPASVTPAHYLSSVQLPTEQDEDAEVTAAAGPDAPPTRDQLPTSTVLSTSPLRKPHVHGPSCRSTSTSPLSILLATLLISAITAAALLSLCSPPFNLSITQTLPPSPLSDTIGRLPSTPACTSINQASARMRQQAALARRSFHLHTSQLLSSIQQRYTQATALLFPPAPPVPAATASGPGDSATAPPLAHHAQVRLLLQQLVPGLAQLDAGADRPRALGDAWEAAAELAAEKHKALGILLPCSTPDACTAAAAHLTASETSEPGCAVELSLTAAAAAGAEAAGWLQLQLGQLMTSCCGAQAQHCSGSRGLLAVVLGLDAARLPMLSVLANVLSESGNLQQGGVSLPMHRATFVFPMAAAAGSEAEGAEEDGWSYEGAARRWKDELVARLGASEGARDGGSGEDEGVRERQQSVFKALRRRLDVVLPLAQ